MINFLYLDYPNKEKESLIKKTRERKIRRYFKNSVDTIDTTVVIRGKSYKAEVDYQAMLKSVNLDCFNCVDNFCCSGTNIAVIEDYTRKFILDNKEDFNRLTKIIDILKSLGYDENQIDNFIKNEDNLVPNEILEYEIETCPCAFKPSNSSMLCSLHALCLEKDKEVDEIIKLKPIICGIFPIEIYAEDDLSKLYITAPTEYNNEILIDVFYDSIPCINPKITEQPMFRRNNPEGFKKKDYKPLILAMEKSIKASLGEVFYNSVIETLTEEGLLVGEIPNQQILKKS